MIIRVPDLKEEVRQLEFVEPAAVLNDRIDAAARPEEQHFSGDLHVTGEIYRSERDVHFSGRIEGAVEATCVRCLDGFERPLEREFRFVILPRAAADDEADDEGVDHYSGDELDLGPLVTEQALLALDPLPVCSEDCRGLCPKCGAKVGSDECRCDETKGTPKLRHLFQV